jgi:hypothetical protein
MIAAGEALNTWGAAPDAATLLRSNGGAAWPATGQAMAGQPTSWPTRGMVRIGR